MTGPEHYRKAERLLASRQHRNMFGDVELRAPSEEAVAQAQVHATLALAAATAIRPHRFLYGDPKWTEWTDVASGASVASAARKEGLR